MQKLFSNLSLTTKLAAIIIMINLVGLVAITYHGWRSEIVSSLEDAEQGWTITTQQMANIAAGGVKWNKAEAVQDAYALYRDESQGTLIYFSAVNGSGATVDSWARAGTITVEAGNAAATALISKAPEKAAADETAGGPGTVTVVAPLPAGKNGKPGGFVTTIWSTGTILAAAEAHSLMLVGSQTAVIAIVIGTFLVAMRGLVGKPLTALSTRIGQLQNGDLASPVAHGHRGDEIGVIARALDVFRREAEDKIVRDDASGRQAMAMEEERLRGARQIEEGANRQSQAIAKLGDALEGLASGDFAVSLPDIGADFEKLRYDFNRMVAAVSAAISDIGGSAMSVEASATEIAHSTDDLSRRTEQQAAALEQTAAALDEITATVRNSSLRANEAGTLVTNAKKGAANSASVVAKAIGAMDRIQNSSSQIGQIIGVIDEIAFQTNLLALNAGVEAARAGEAGKGFAVVAQEVRELAQRSAAAAKEIKDLVTASGTEVASGVALVNETGNALRTIETEINKINESIQAIVLSSDEQSSGLQEINSAINQMDQGTQQNAAMVEETNAACQELTTQSRRLREAVNRFKYDGQHSPAVPAAAGVAKPAPPARSTAPARSAIHEIRGNAAVAARTSEWEEF